MIREAHKYMRQWLACRRLNRLTAARRKQFIIEHPEYETRRKQSLRHKPRMGKMSDWQIGDLALAVNCDCGGVHSPGDGCSVGVIYHVSGIRPGPFWGCRASAGLHLAEFPDNVLGSCCERFRKVAGDKHEACEPEFVTLLQRIKRKEVA